MGQTMPEGAITLGERTREALEHAEARMLDSGDDQVPVKRAQLQALVDELRDHGPLAAAVSEVGRVRDMLEHILQNPDEPTLPIEELDDRTVTIERGDLWMILHILTLGPRSDDRTIVQSDRERACAILERWGGKDNVQVVFETGRGARDYEQGFAGELVRAFRDHRISAPATMPGEEDEGTRPSASAPPQRSGTPRACASTTRRRSTRT